MSQNNKCELILALDLENINEIKAILSTVGNQLKWVKIGLQLYLAYGSDIVKQISDMGYKVFLDLKLHDIPNTVANAVKSLRHLPIDMLTLHTSGGQEMLRYAVNSKNEHIPHLKLLGVTVLTSMDQKTLTDVFNTSALVEEQVLHLARLNMQAGMDGLVCSPLELNLLRKNLSESPLLVTPGIRPHGENLNEQKRVMTPADAAKSGSNYIVVGRPILASKDPNKVTKNILQDIHS